MPPEMKMSGLNLQPDLGIPTGGPGNNQMSPEKAHTGVQMMGMRASGKQELANAAKSLEGLKLTMNPIDDTFDGKNIPGAVVRSLLESKQQVNQYQDLYNNMIAENLRKQQQMKEHPFQNALAELAASFARNDPNPYTRAVGQSATRLNPSKQELQGEERGLLKEAEGFAARREAIDAGLLRTMEGNEAKSQANFNRMLGTFQQMSKGGLKDPKAYLAAAERLGVDKQTAQDLAAGFVKEAEDRDAVKLADQEWKSVEKGLDRDHKAAIAKANTAVRASAVAVSASRERLRQAQASGKELNPVQVAAEKRRLLALRHAIEKDGVKGIESTALRSAEALTKYLGVAALDKDGAYKAKVEGFTAGARAQAEKASGNAEAALAEIDTLLGMLEGGSSSGDTGGEKPAAAPEKAARPPRDPEFQKALEALEPGQGIKDNQTGLTWYSGPNGPTTDPNELSRVPQLGDYAERPERKLAPVPSLKDYKPKPKPVGPSGDRWRR